MITITKIVNIDSPSGLYTFTWNNTGNECVSFSPSTGTTTGSISTQVSFSNEMYELCKALGLDYDKVIEYATLDSRLGTSHWSVPGPDGDLGFGGHCFPKDLSAIIKMTEELDTTNNILKATKQTNNKIRKNRDWENMKGRAIN